MSGLLHILLQNVKVFKAHGIILHGLGIKHVFLLFLFFFLKFAHKKGEVQNKTTQSKASYKECSLYSCLGEANGTSAIFFRRLLFLFPILYARRRFHPITSVPFYLLYFITW